MSKASHETKISEAIADEARRWVIEFDAGDVSPEERGRFMRWLNADPLHRQAYDELQNQWRQYDVVQQLRTDDVDSEVVGKWLRRRSLRRWTAPLAAAATIAAVAFGLWFTQTAPVYEAEYGTTVGQQRVITLPDESSITLNTKSRVKIRYTDDERRIELERRPIDQRLPNVGLARHQGLRRLGPVADQVMAAVVGDLRLAGFAPDRDDVERGAAQ